MAGLLSVARKAEPLLYTEQDTGRTDVSTPSTATVSLDSREGEERGRNGRPQRPAYAQQPMRRSDSHLTIHKEIETEWPLDHTPSARLRSMPPVDRTSKQPSQVEGRRWCSNSQIGARRCSKGIEAPDKAAQREIMTRLSNMTGTNVSKHHHEGEGSANIPIVDRSGCGPDLKWPLSTCPVPGSELQNDSRTSRRPSSKPLKACLKRKAKSANTTPPNGTTISCKSPLEDQKLRRIKTVDFADAISESLPSRTMNLGGTSEHRQKHQARLTKQSSSFPGTTFLTKRSPAQPAVTRTDVHVIAISPSSAKSRAMEKPQAGEAGKCDPATPTMQIVESSNGSHEIIWDDVPPDHNARTQRRSSSAGEALEALSAGTRNLERVNSKLSEWSGTWNSPSDGFKPTIVVFPDDDGHRPPYECAIAGDEESGIFAPPNSERASAIHSRHTSRPTSARMSRAPSHDEPSASPIIPSTSLGVSRAAIERAQSAPDPQAWPSHLAAARRNLGHLSPERKLSNIDEGDVRFRNHRDSVTLAHSRLVKSGGLSGGVRPETLAHKDSVAMAKRRMHARNQAASASQQVNPPEERSDLHVGPATATL